ncbi:hypothetical protein C0J08_06370 [Marinomonas sp. CT5]|uniref:hypothetical protein n=1 Tax=Marinomonas sp. CT5 TaxID=2066133 RepID=UPI001856785E|nr:hypothetical protein [Marinomonas sp. CT5]NVK75081.1 hypothetical protein [Oceanospirillaceae bacterium]QUX95063.1 hypothetical protein C0J08_06370 [Marinomonas sp. CT5]
MPTLRTGLLLATLLLSACSMPFLPKQEHNIAQDTTEQKLTENTDDTTAAKAEPAVKENSSVTKTELNNENDNNRAKLIEQFAAQKQLAKANYIELKNRVGKATELPRSLTTDSLNSQQINDKIQQLRTYISKTNTELATLNARVEDRQKVAIHGDLIRVFLSETTVKDKESSFKAQPLVGQWVRGESRVIRLKDNFLFENPKSADLKISFSESYQLIVNNQVIATINPNREKNSARFHVATEDTKGKIDGQLDYRIIGDKE